MLLGWRGASIVPNVDVTVGMRSEVGDEAARAFAAAFYQALAYGRTVQEAFEQSRVGMLLETGAGADLPVLRCRSGIDASTYVLFRREVGDYAALGLAIGSPVRLFFGGRSKDLEPLLRSSMMLAVVYQEFASLRAAEQLDRRVIERFYGRVLKELTLEVERTDALYASVSGARDRWIGVLGQFQQASLRSCWRAWPSLGSPRGRCEPSLRVWNRISARRVSNRRLSARSCAWRQRFLNPCSRFR